ncbi:ABC transporter ATP-binding protein [Albidovulum sp.]|uniref:ABC transporter ATP-binding protein n=1 Tax=Albidovulum sp. TaxID=1872424 RepID=UPI001E11473F|nr:ABC transporter ATP-binding protein [Paracoccaceae bacterium]MCC0046883.1 ABC transporter ATP-binding protein [Defluviimonas sp.]HPE24138.1 ABC transporter ATP-binding protein [Albidovulum sp.]MCB2131862.1 ABC transporter ATP-binding protein [Paracoccaceae bacterium]MCB2139708.1 ABC transporter ATP-binding protein [Paracoccaceae bacterium]
MSDVILDIRGLEKSFGALKATDGVTLDLRRGEIHALIGPNGAGKSTLIKQITGEIRQDRGSITFEGQAIDGLDAAARARLGLARSFQVSSVVPEFTALENTMLAVLGAGGGVFRFLRPALHDPALTDPARFHLDQAGLAGRAAVPAGVLSHGERRRLEIAMALAMRPRAFLLDEPMAGMGAEGARDLTAILSDLRAEAPILLVEHDMDAVFALADRISVLVYGRIIATGSVEEIRANAEVRRSYLGEEA